MRKRSGLGSDIVGGSVAVLETIKEISAAISVVPGLGAAIGASIILLKTIEKVTELNERSERLVRRTTELIQHIEQRISQDVGAIDSDLTRNLANLASTLQYIESDLQQRHKRRFTSRLLHYSSTSSKLDEHIDTIERARDSFNVWCILSLDRKLNKQLQQTHKQATTDDTGYHLFQRTELQLRSVRGRWYLSGSEAGEEWTGEWGGRAVAIRRFRGELALKEDPASLCLRMPQIFHPYVAQVLGYSHPNITEKFYVIETGSMPLDGKYIWEALDTKNLLCAWMQTLLQHKEAIDFASPYRISSYDCRHEFPNSTIHPDGTLLLDAQDLICTHPLSMCYFWEGQCIPESSRLGYWGYLPPYQSEAYFDVLRKCLFQVKAAGPSMHPVITLKAYMQRKTNVYYYDLEDVCLGDVGYYDATTSGKQTFVCLGNVTELLSDPALHPEDGIWEYPQHSEPCPFVEGECGGRQCLRLKLTPHRTHATYYYRLAQTLRRNWLDAYWDHIFDIAELYGVAAHKLILVAELRRLAFAHVVGGCSGSDPCENEQARGIWSEGWVIHEVPCLGHQAGLDTHPVHVYYHIDTSFDKRSLPRSNHTPPGFWSLDPEPCPGPWPSLFVPGTTLQCWATEEPLGEQLTYLEAELFRYLQCRRKTAEEDKLRFEEVSST
ncbi:hypothetical protein CERSUDRAFT_114098 [Gelatoporia subvermispora B]|uniref:Uncharacterized protein n=1 Tax=Ceriporiopsis subvermispora (strain B) TaxID=914234 RepID=M2PM66_CERS8|nr:hypothetical protein CERSUDRAFT_114098 [Gelatoporia subvermispora B]